jgi:hypothetical protein
VNVGISAICPRERSLLHALHAYHIPLSAARRPPSNTPVAWSAFHGPPSMRTRSLFSLLTDHTHTLSFSFLLVIPILAKCLGINRPCRWLSLPRGLDPRVVPRRGVETLQLPIAKTYMVPPSIVARDIARFLRCVRRHERSMTRQRGWPTWSRYPEITKRPRASVLRSERPSKARVYN